MHQRGNVNYRRVCMVMIVLVIGIIGIVGNQFYINKVLTGQWERLELESCFKDIEKTQDHYITTSNDPQIIIETKTKPIQWIEMHIGDLEGTLNGKIYYTLEENDFNEEDTLEITLKNGYNQIEFPKEVDTKYIRLDLTDQSQVQFDLKEVCIKYESIINEWIDKIIYIILISFVLYEIHRCRIKIFFLPLIYYVTQSILYQMGINISSYILVIVYTTAVLLIARRVLGQLTAIENRSIKYIKHLVIITGVYLVVGVLAQFYSYTGAINIYEVIKNYTTKLYDVNDIKDHIGGASITSDGIITSQSEDPYIIIEDFDNAIYGIQLDIELISQETMDANIYYAAQQDVFTVQAFKKYSIKSGTNLISLAKTIQCEKVRLDIGEKIGECYQIKNITLNPTQSIANRCLQSMIIIVSIGLIAIIGVVYLAKQPKAVRWGLEHLEKGVCIALALYLFFVMYKQKLAWWFIIAFVIIVYLSFKQANLVVKFIVLASTFGVAIAFLLPPMQVPDEPVHLARAYHLARGHIMYASIAEDVPLSIEKYLQQVESVEISSNSSKKVNLDKFFKANTMPLHKKVTGKLSDAEKTKAYLIGAYVPQAVGIFLADLIHLSPYYVLQMGRIFNLLTYILIGSIALQKIPIKKELLMIIMLLPMSLQQAASLSPDALLNTCSFLLIAYILKLKDRTQSTSYKELIGISLCGIVIISIKMPYVILMLLLVSVPSRAFCIKGDTNPWLHKIGALVGTMGVPLLFYKLCNLWLVGTQPTSSVEIATSEPSIGATIVKILSNLGEFIRIVWDTLIARGEFYIESMIGWFGWLDAPLPKIAIMITIAIVIIISLLPESEDRGILKQLDRVLFMIFFLGLSGILWVVSIHWYDIPYEEIQFLEGTQGRYFIAFILLLGLCISRIAPKLEIEHKYKHLASSIVSLYIPWILIMTVSTLLYRYWI